MLQSMRNHLKGVVAYVLVGLIIIIFALFGANALFMGGLTQDTVAEVNGHKVTELDLARGLARQKQQLRSMLGDKIDAKFLDDEFLRPTVKNNLVQRALLADAAERNGLRVGTPELDKRILEDATFQRDGRFDAGLYKSILRQYGFLPSTYREELQSNQLISQYQQTITETGFVTPKEISELARLLFEKRSFVFTTLSLEQAAAQVSVSDENLQAYYENHKGEFMSDAQAAVEYILLSKQAIINSLSITEEQIQEQYQAEVAEAQKKVERHAAHILIEEKEDGSHLALLSDLQEQIKQGADFSELAKKYSADTGSAQQGGDVGVTTGSSFVKEFEETLATMQAGQVSEPVKTQFGYHIIKLLDQKQAQVPPLAERHQRIEQDLKSALADEQYAEKIERLQEESHQAVSLSSVASKLSDSDFTVTVKQTALFSQKNPQALFLSSPALRSPKVLQAIFTEGAQVGIVTDVLELSPEQTLVLRITEYQPPAEQSLDVVKDRVQNQYTHEVAAQKLAEQSSTLLQQVLAGETLDAVGKKQGLRVEAANNKQRSDETPAHELIAKAFAIAAPHEGRVSADTLQLANGDWALIQVNSSDTPMAEALSEEQLQQASQRLKGANNNDFSALLAMLTKEADIVYRSQATVAQ